MGCHGLLALDLTFPLTRSMSPVVISLGYPLPHCLTFLAWVLREQNRKNKTGQNPCLLFCTTWEKGRKDTKMTSKIINMEMDIDCYCHQKVRAQS